MILTKLVGGCCVAMLLFACNKTKDLEQVRLFRPVLRSEMIADGNYIDVNWQPIKGSSGYTVQLSADTFKTVLKSATVDTNAHSFNNLAWNQLYQVRVKANAPDTALSSKWSVLGAIKTARFPSILNAPTLNDISDVAVKVSWMNSGNAVTGIKILKASDSSVVKDVALTAGDVTSQYKIVTGLSSSTAYIIFLYSGTTVRGWENFSTKATLTGAIIDLRGITDRPSVLADTLPQIAAGSIVLLKRGYTYTIGSALALSKTVTIMSGDDLATSDRAMISLVSNFNIAAGSVIDSIVFKNVVLFSDSYSAKYVFNVNAACTIGSMKFEDCKAEIFRGMVRLQTAVINMTTFSIDKCIIDSVSNYGVVNVDNTNCKIDNISITNSTIYKAEKIITSRQNSKTVLVENCTVNEAPWGNNYFIDYSTSGTNNVELGIKVRNCIFGIGKNNAGVTAVRGIRAGAATSIDVFNNFNTSDYTLAATSPSPIPGLTPYGKSSAELWRSPQTGDFTIIDNTFPGKTTTGDPRWRP